MGRADLEPAAASDLGRQLGAHRLVAHQAVGLRRADGLEEHRGAPPLPRRRRGQHRCQGTHDGSLAREQDRRGDRLPLPVPVGAQRGGGVGWSGGGDR